MPKDVFEYLMEGPITSGKWPNPQYRSSVQRFRNIVGPATSYENFIDAVNSPEFKALLKP